MVGMLVRCSARGIRATFDEDVPLDRTRTLLALVALVMFVLCFTPAPISPFDLTRVRRVSSRAVHAQPTPGFGTPAEAGRCDINLLQHADRIHVDDDASLEFGPRRDGRQQRSRASRFRFDPFIRSCARYSPRSLPSGAGAGPSTRRPARSASPRSRCAISAASSIAPANVRDADDRVDERHERRIAHRCAETRSSRSKNAR